MTWTTRSEWGSQETDPAGYQMGKVYEVVVGRHWRHGGVT